MNGPRKLLLATIIILSAVPSFGSASAVWVTQNGAGSKNGTSLSNAFPISALSNSSNCGSGSTQIGPGTTVNIQGVGTFANNTTMFTLPSACSGTSSNPVLLQFKAGDVWQAGYFPSGGLIVVSKGSYIVMDGGGTGGAGATFQNTTNGSPTATCLSGSACTTQQPSKWLEALGMTSLEVRNFNVIDLYIHTQCEASSGCDSKINNTDVVGIHYGGTVSVHDNVMHDISWINYAFTGTTSSQSFYNNEFYNMDHGIACGANASGAVISNLYIYNNHFHDMAAWDTGTADTYHHAGIHCWSATGGKVQNVYIYNNLFDGNEGNCCVTGWVYLEGSTGPPWGDSTSTAYAWNNVIIGSLDLPNGQFIVQGGNGHEFLNNTIMVANPNGGGCLTFSQSVTNVVIENNVIEGCNALIDASGATSFATIDHNAYGHPSGGNSIFQFRSSSANTLTSWQSACGCDLHSVASNPISGVLANISSQGVPSSGFVGIGAGINSTPSATGSLLSLTSDTGAGNTHTPVPRQPEPISWDAGAYLYGSGSQLSPPTGLSASVQ